MVDTEDIATEAPFFDFEEEAVTPSFMKGELKHKQLKPREDKARNYL